MENESFCRVCECADDLRNIDEYRRTFRSVTGINVTPPAYLCIGCIKTLAAARKFQKQAIAVDYKLRLGNCVKLEPSNARTLNDDAYLKDESASSRSTSPDIRKKSEVQTKDCPYCFETFESYQKRFQHIKNHILLNAGLECDFCHRKYSTKKILQFHIFNIHINAEKRITKCEDCEKEFTNSHSYKDHQRIVHSKGMQFQ